MKAGAKWLLVVSISIFTIEVPANVNSRYYPRTYVWGFQGNRGVGEIDLMQPMNVGCNNLFYMDVQSKGATNNSWFLGLGSGYRGIYNNRIYGGYLFLDRNVSRRHNQFWVLNPGIETIGRCWDLRINGYFPTSEKTKEFKNFLPNTINDCDFLPNNNDCEFAEFHGHQQFAHAFSHLEQIGPGVDGELGIKFACLNDFAIRGGGYYFHLEDVGRITGIESRLELPVNPGFVLTVVASYDNKQQGALLAGIRLQFGHNHACCPTLCDYLYDPIVRNLSTFKQGTDIPVIETKKDKGLVLQRDNVFFFSGTGGNPFVNADVSGTFENPLSNDQFSQSVIDQIGENANFYLNSGTYVITGTGIPLNAIINLLPGDSIFGRTLDYRCPAFGDERPILLGSITLPGDNTLASIQLFNNGISSGTTNSNFIALSIQDASNVFLCNDNIVASATVNGDLDPGIVNSAVAIFANNSQVTINRSSITAIATVNGTLFRNEERSLFSNNSAVGIGAVAVVPGITNFSNNIFTILNSSINATATAQSNLGDNNAAGIGVIAAFQRQGNFDNNTFELSNTSINSSAEVTSTRFNAGLNLAIGIGNGSHSGVNNADFSSTNFSLSSSQINSLASVSGDNGRLNINVGIGNFQGDFTSNNFQISDTSINNAATVGGDDFSAGVNRSIGIGTPAGSGFFSFNNFIITNTSINTVALVNGNSVMNDAIGIGNLGATLFDHNVFHLTNTTLDTLALVRGDNTLINDATGIGGNFAFSSNNTTTLQNCLINTLAEVDGTNIGTNSAFGLDGRGAGNLINVNGSIVNTTAIASPGVNTAFGHLGNVISDPATVYNTTTIP